MYNLRKFINLKKTPLQIKYLYQFGNYQSDKNMIAQSKFIKNELAIRLSHRVYDLIHLPYGLPQIKEINGIIDLYVNSFNKINDFKKIENTNDLNHFSKVLDGIRNQHSNLENSISLGLQKINFPIMNYNLLNNNLDDFFLSRIGIRTLISQHIEMSNQNGSIIKNINLNNIIQESIFTTSNICERVYGDVPIIKYKENNKINFLYIKSHLYYIINEILKNSIVATQDNNINEPIEINVSEGKEDIIIKIKDKGLGFRRKNKKKVLTYSYTTSSLDITDEFEICNLPIISGFGFGLPLAKVYANYFGGDLIINPMENIGTSVYIYINKLGDGKEII